MGKNRKTFGLGRHFQQAGQGLLFGVLDSTTWLARGAVNLLFVPLLAIALKVGLVLLIGYLVLRVVSPGKAEKVKEKLRRVK